MTTQQKMDKVIDSIGYSIAFVSIVVAMTASLSSL